MLSVGNIKKNDLLSEHQLRSVCTSTSISIYVYNNHIKTKHFYEGNVLDGFRLPASMSLLMYIPYVYVGGNIQFFDSFLVCKASQLHLISYNKPYPLKPALLRNIYVYVSFALIEHFFVISISCHL